MMATWRRRQRASLIENIKYAFTTDVGDHELEMVFVEGTRGQPYSFGDDKARLAVEIPDFFISRFTVTQALWKHVMGAGDNPAHHRGDLLPVERVSWDEITSSDGFLARINTSGVLEAIQRWLPGHRKARFRLPTETEWEYAARGGIHWTDGFLFSGSHEIDTVAWYKDNSGNVTHDVGQKAPNQLGIYDMCGNIWEWCQDCHTRDITNIPQDGSAFMGEGGDRILRGGCFHNWAIHCTVSKRYEIGAEYGDPCIGFRLVLSVS